ncbi:MAG: tetratricopeptide repeat protein [Actinobacteria bacterium]|uniref:Unannotated protein n=1 Tax=freshwater metagenome TaxID=449393 RepID=A0A6J6TN96_9ZZZZ|nr:tetratricopeptide repeat protein [Actinomycetota bacterium]MSX25376.1 tetratricopeptide repeat protein [Actinomycetota bacterium]MSY46353.1 tetratricopeptide repeat protein [Actinomycetota bacterium]MSY57244.1 tetratricopeptide repeat protein [Actinomycetota bacterium]
MTLPPNFGRAVDLSALGKPPAPTPTSLAGNAVTAQIFSEQLLPLSKTKPVVLICWSARSSESLAIAEILAKLQSVDSDRWELGSINVDVETQVAQALQVRTVPFAVAIIAEQLVPLFEQSYPEAQIKMVIDKVLTIAAEQGVGQAPQEVIEPEEDEALTALEAGDYLAAESAYKRLLFRKPSDLYAKLGLAQTQLLIRTSGLIAEEIFVKSHDNPADLNLQMQCADLEVLRGDLEGAFKRMLDLIRTVSGAEQSTLKTHLLDLFTLVDPADPRLVKARNALASALF